MTNVMNIPITTFPRIFLHLFVLKI
jgi:hypothetical protein